jgi:hypothetical protein
MEVSQLELWCQISSSSGRFPGYPHAVRRDQRREERNISRVRKPVLVRFVGSHVNNRVNIGLSVIAYQNNYEAKVISRAYKWHPCKVPEDDHETPLFVEHIPCLRNTFFTFAASKAK